MINQIVFMIRNGLAGTNYEYKLFTTFIGIALCVIDWKKHERLEYTWVFLVGTTIWTSYEFVLQVVGVRDVSQGMLFGREISVFTATG
ncbi:MAG: hypothetical protein ACTSU5_19320 [Promethearchaeota archaeon]